ncbi:hypothetical protein HHK36_019437 [Tetracentron sinense]|uniref:Uncharacterized protein n=1 Tax=Tetracentron sinense TaxID=13715 RepID=A0A835DA17_TETSI|nr:hypothetical protein HHK36_019437 [Tetracentron sinense]
MDFHTNKKVLEEVVIIPSKCLLNKKACCIVPDEFTIKTDLMEVDKETIDMHAALGMADLPNIVKQAEPALATGGPGILRGEAKRALRGEDLYLPSGS